MKLAGLVELDEADNFGAGRPALRLPTKMYCLPIRGSFAARGKCQPRSAGRTPQPILMGRSGIGFCTRMLNSPT